MAHGLLLQPFRVWLALANGSPTVGGIEQILLDLQGIALFAADLRARFEHEGLDGLEGALDLYRRLKGTLDGISGADIVRVRADIERLTDRFEGLARALEELGRLKRAIAV